MMLFKTPIESSALIVLTITYFLFTSVSEYDIKIIRSLNMGGKIKPLPNWIAAFHVMQWINWFFILLLNGYYGLILISIKLLLRIIPVLERLGAFLSLSFDPNHKMKNRRS